MTSSIPDGYELLPGLTKDNAKTAITLAEERGLDASVVLTSTMLSGFLIPLTDADGNRVAEADAIETEPGSEGAEPYVVETASLEDLTVPELKDVADKGGVDLAGATKKADIISAIEGSDKVQVQAPAEETAAEETDAEASADAEQTDAEAPADADPKGD